MLGSKGIVCYEVEGGGRRGLISILYISYIREEKKKRIVL